VVISARRVLLPALCVLTACSAQVTPSATTPPPTTSPIATPIAPPQAAPSNSAAPIPTLNQPSLGIDRFAEVVTTDLVVRSAPGTGRDSEMYGTVANLAVTVLDGPVQADGYEWWLIRPIHSDGFEPPPSGWVAAGGQGEVWLAPTSISCDDAPTSEALWGMPSAMWVGCYAGVELTLRGTLSGCFAGEGTGWDGCVLRNCVPDVCQRLVDDRPVVVHFDALPASDVGRIRITGHFDDPAAESVCRVDGSALSRLSVFRCRTHFVATSYQLAD
jgi:hypothetical protein